MYDMYIAQGGGGPNVRYVQCLRGGSQCTIYTVPKGRVPMYNVYIAQGEGPNVQCVQCPRGGSEGTICTVPKGGGAYVRYVYGP